MRSAKAVKLYCALLVCMTCMETVPAAEPILLTSSFFSHSLGFAPDGNHIVYLADQNSDFVVQLYSIPVAGGTPTTLNGTLVAGGDVMDLTISPDGNRVLYIADQNTNDRFEIYTAPITGGDSVKMNAPIVYGGSVTLPFSDPIFSPDGSRVLYYGDQNSDNVFELFSSPATSNSPVKISGSLPIAGDVESDYQFSPDSSRVIYVADQNTNDILELYSVPAAGGPSIKLNGPLTPGGRVILSGDSISSDSNYVVYGADRETDGVFEFYSVPITGGASVNLNSNPVSGGDVALGSQRISPDGSRVVYHGDIDTDNVNELYSVPITGGTPTKLNGSLVNGGRVVQLEHNPFSPDGSKVLYLANQDTASIEELYIVPTSGGAPLRLNGTVVSGGTIYPSNIQFTPDGNRVLYTGDQDTEGVIELFSVPATGGTPTKLNTSLSLNGGFVDGRIQVSADGERTLFYTLSELEEGEAFLVPTAGGTPMSIAGKGVSRAQLSPNGSHVIYTKYDSGNSASSLYSRIVGLQWDHTSGDWDTAANWDQSVTPDEIMKVSIDASATVTATGNSTTRQVNQLRIGGGSGTSTLELASSAVIDVLNGVRIDAGGVICGDGEILGDVTSAVDAEVHTDAAQSLHFGGSFGNQGQIEAIGDANDLAQIEFDGQVTNAATGTIAGQRAQFLFNGGLTNQGTLAFSASESDVYGDINNDGDIAVSEGADVMFYNDVFFGSGATLTIELGGATAGSEYDRLEILGEANLGGTLEVALVDLGGGTFQPDGGDVFEILSADDGRYGTFTEDLPNLRGGLYWDVVYDADSVSLVVEGVVGDYNLDGKVSAADFTVWRDTLGSTSDSALAADGSGNGIVDQDDFQVWKDQYGEGAFGSGAGNAVNSTSIPEPASSTLAGIDALLLFSWSLRRRDTFRFVARPTMAIQQISVVLQETRLAARDRSHVDQRF